MARESAMHQILHHYSSIDSHEQVRIGVATLVRFHETRLPYSGKCSSITCTGVSHFWIVPQRLTKWQR